MVKDFSRNNNFCSTQAKISLITVKLVVVKEDAQVTEEDVDNMREMETNGLLW